MHNHNNKWQSSCRLSLSPPANGKYAVALSLMMPFTYMYTTSFTVNTSTQWMIGPVPLCFDTKGESCINDNLILLRRGVTERPLIN